MIPLVVFGGVLAWWGWKSGGYFEVTYLPGTMILLGVVAAFLLFAPALGTLRGAALVSLAGLIGLAAWTLISGLWSPVPAVAFSDSQRVVAYIAAFVIGALVLPAARPPTAALPQPPGGGGVRGRPDLADRPLDRHEFQGLLRDGLHPPLSDRLPQRRGGLLPDGVAAGDRALCFARASLAGSRGPARILDADDRTGDPRSEPGLDVRGDHRGGCADRGASRAAESARLADAGCDSSRHRAALAARPIPTRCRQKLSRDPPPPQGVRRDGDHVGAEPGRRPGRRALGSGFTAPDASGAGSAVRFWRSSRWSS